MASFRLVGTRVTSVSAAIVALACSSPSASPDGSSAAHGGASAAGSGGTSTSGGSSPSGGGATASAGAALGVGGALGAGGANAASGGSPASGGATTTAGGASAASGAGGKAAGSGGLSAAGGAASGGKASEGGTAGTATGGGGESAPSTGCGVATSLKSGRATLSVAGTMREYILRIPDNYDAERAHKLIFAFHARGGNAAGISGAANNDYYGLYSRAAGSAIFVSPEGLDAGWRNTNGVDIAFVKAMLSEFNSKLCIDERRIFSVGFSFGGMMSDAIGCAMADVFRAIAPMAGAIPNPEHPYSGCEQPNMHPIAVWMSHGDNDTTVPLADGKDALDIFLARNKCQAQTVAVSPSPCVAYQGCTEGYPIHYCQFSGGHSVPSFAAAGIWSFFDQF